MINSIKKKNTIYKLHIPIPKNLNLIIMIIIDKKIKITTRVSGCYENMAAGKNYMYMSGKWLCYYLASNGSHIHVSANEGEQTL